MVTWLDGGDIVISGSEALTKPGGFQFTATGGNEPYTWSVSGTGVTINSTTGYVTMGDDACGSFTVTCTDCTGRSSSHVGTRVTNNGSWGVLYHCQCWPPWSSGWTVRTGDTLYSGSLKQIIYYCAHEGYYSDGNWLCNSGLTDDSRPCSGIQTGCILCGQGLHSVSWYTLGGYDVKCEVELACDTWVWSC